MLPAKPAPLPLSPAEIDAALRTIPQSGWIRLRKVAQAYARGRGLDDGDLLQEACCRALDGRRQCPRDIEVVRFLAETIRSIAFDEVKAAKRRPELRLVPAFGGEEAAVDPPDEQPTAEQQLIAEQEVTRVRQAILSLFADDLAAQIIVEGRMDEMEGEDLRALTDLDATAFATKCRLIRRRIDKAYPKGWTS